MNRLVVILYGKLSANPQPDELDVFDEINFIEDALTKINYSTSRLEFSFNLEKVRAELLKLNPLVVFNLVEAIEGKSELHYLAPAILEEMNIPFTGGNAENLLITTNKVLTKKILQANGIPTAPWLLPNQQFENFKKKYIIKPIKEDASVDITDESVFIPSNPDILNKIEKFNSEKYFIEEYIEGREFNISVIQTNAKPMVFPFAEIIFSNYPKNKPKIMGYQSKWQEETFEYQNTARTFELSNFTENQKKNITEICLNCWGILNLKGYARIDFRIDANNNPYVIEVNSNPCISDNGGFIAASEMAGYSNLQIVEKIINNAL